MSKKEVEITLNEVTQDLCNLDIGNNIKLQRKALLGKEIGLTPSELIILIYEMEKRLNIHFDRDELLSDNIMTYNGILNIALAHVDEEN